MPNVEPVLRAVKAIKENVAAAEGAGTDLTPTVLVHTTDGVTAAHLGRVDRLPLATRLRQVVAAFGADYVAFTHEAYLLIGPEGLGLAEGELARRFAAGDPNVAEVINVVGLGTDGAGTMVSLPYHYEGRRVVWDPPVRPPDSGGVRLGGLFPDAVAAGFADRGRPDWWTAALRLAAGGILVQGPHGELVSPEGLPRAEDACPCGSGRVYRSCHGRS